MDDFIIFFHLAGDGYFFEKSYEKINKVLTNNKLNEHTIYCYNGSIKKINLNPTEHTIYLRNDCNLFESTTLNFLLKECQNFDKNKKVLYIHTKGAYNYEKPIYDDWIDVMSYFTIEKYKTCLSYLNDFDAVGVDYLLDPWKHFSGNFWWANSDHIKKLTKISSKDRYVCEKWICSEKGKFLNLFTTGINVLEKKRCIKESYIV